MQGLDLREYKGKLRVKIKAWRAALPAAEKAALDDGIRRRLLATYQYRDCRTLMIYVSTDIEVDTRAIIAAALTSGRQVAVPRCVPGTREMTFHYITDLSQLRSGTFGVLEPSEELPLAETPVAPLMVVPALSLDAFGFRLGYGGGYYDRCLSRFEGESIGICYSENTCYRLCHGRYDVPLKAVLTEKYVRRIEGRRQGGNHGRI